MADLEKYAGFADIFKNPEGGLDQKALVAMIRANMDRRPAVAGAMFNLVGDKRGAIHDLLEWIGSMEQRSDSRLKKLGGLIDTLKEGHYIDEFLDEIRVSADEGSSEKKTFRSDDLIKLAKEDPERILLLIEAARTDEASMKALLRVWGLDYEYDPEEEKNVEIGSYWAHGLLQSAAHGGNFKLAQALLEASAESGLVGEMFGKGSLIGAFRLAAQHGNLDFLERVVELAQSLERENPSIQFSSKSLTVHSLIEAHFDRMKLGKKAGHKDISTVLWIGAEQDGYDYKKTSLLLALESGNPEMTKFIYRSLCADKNGAENVGRNLYFSFRYEGEVAADLNGADALELLWVKKVFLQHFNEAVQAGEEALSTFFLKIYPSLKKKKRSSHRIPKEEKREESMMADPRESDEFLELTNFLDQMVRAEGKGKEWAQKLATLFPDVEEAKAFLRSGMRYALAKPNDRAIWEHRGSRTYINWPDEFAQPVEGEIPQVEAIEAVMNFDLPQEDFDPTSWQKILIEFPEASKYIQLAPDIERYLSAHSKEFPEDLISLRALVLEVDSQKCALLPPLVQQLRNKLNHPAPVSEDRKGSSKPFETAVVLHASTLPRIKAMIKRLSVMGVLGNAAEKISRNYILRPATFYHYDKHTGEQFECPLDTYQLILNQHESSEGLDLMTQILEHGEAIAFKAPHSIVFNLDGLEAGENLELIKQLCISLVMASSNKMLLDHLIPLIFLDTPNRPRNVKKLRAQILEEILKANSFEEMGTSYSVHAPMGFHTEEGTAQELTFMVKVEKIENITREAFFREFEAVNAFLERSLAMIRSNGGKARIPEKELQLPKANPLGLWLKRYVGEPR